MFGYVAGMAVVAGAAGESWTSVALCEAGRQDPPFLRWTVLPITWLCGCLLMSVVPGWPWAAALRWARSDALSLLATAVAMSIATQIVAGTAFKILFPTTPLDRLRYVLLLLLVFSPSR